MTGWLTSWTSIAVILVVLVGLFALYSNTVGYSIQLGWNKLQASRAAGETVQVTAPGGLSATLTPEPTEGGPGGGGLLDRLETDVEDALQRSRGKEVFNIRRNVFRYEDAEPVCKAFGAELATYDQVKNAYENGADWCNYGWTAGQLALYPTQTSSYDRLQAGPEDQRMSCGLPGVNGGHFPNPDETFGVNCYGVRPTETDLDEDVDAAAAAGTGNPEFDRRVNQYRANRDSIPVSPWSPGHWNEPLL